MKSSYCLYKIKLSNFLLSHDVELFYFKIQRHEAQISQLQQHYKSFQCYTLTLWAVAWHPNCLHSPIEKEMSMLGRTQSGFVLQEVNFCLTHFEKSLVFGLQPEMKQCCQFLLMILVTSCKKPQKCKNRTLLILRKPDACNSQSSPVPLISSMHH